ncbi:MAG: tetratricopeptide repeat protein [Opitutus sp.]|nr:tetratricopeptide repeat protein [Opitutus sp.]
MILEARPTQNSVAYERFVAARFTDREEQAEPLLLEAVRLDPNFSEAWAALVRTHSFIYFNSRGQHTPERLAKAKLALETALRFAPDSHTTIKTQGDFQYSAMKEWEKTAEHYRQALLVGPNVADTLESLGYIYRRLGRWSEALAALRQAAKLDPGSINLSRSLGSVLDAIRRYDEAGVYWRRCADLKPDEPFQRYLYALLATGKGCCARARLSFPTAARTTGSTGSHGQVSPTALRSSATGNSPSTNSKNASERPTPDMSTRSATTQIGARSKAIPASRPCSTTRRTTRHCSEKHLDVLQRTRFSASRHGSEEQLDVAAMYAPLLAVIVLYLGRWSREAKGRWGIPRAPVWPWLTVLALVASALLYRYKWSMSASTVLTTLILLVGLLGLADVFFARGKLRFRWLGWSTAALVAAIACRQLDVAGNSAAQTPGSKDMPSGIC